MDLDDLLKQHVGQFGRYQKFLFFFIAIEEVFIAFQSMSPVIFLGSPDHWCSTPTEHLPNCSHEEVLQFSIPRIYQNNKLVYSQCEMYDRNYSMFTDDICPNDVVGDLNTTEEAGTRACQSWSYDHSLYTKTIITEVGSQYHIFKTNNLKLINSYSGESVVFEYSTKLSIGCWTGS